MSVHLVAEAIDTIPSVEDHEAYLKVHDLAATDPTCLPLMLYADTRRGLSDAISELLLCSGCAQPTVAEFRRRPQRRDEAPRIVVALRQVPRDLYVFAAEQLNHADVHYLANLTDAAGVDLYLLAHLRCRPQTRTALRSAADEILSRRDLAARLLASPSRGGRTTPMPCEAALVVGSGMNAHCANHKSAGHCAVASFADALTACRRSPREVMSRLHELSVTLDAEDSWVVAAASRDLYVFVERAARVLGISSADQSSLRLSDLAPDGSVIRTASCSVAVPVAMRQLLVTFVAVRMTAGGEPHHRLLIPRDDRPLRRWSTPRAGLARNAR